MLEPKSVAGERAVRVERAVPAGASEEPPPVWWMPGKCPSVFSTSLAFGETDGDCSRRL